MSDKTPVTRDGLKKYDHLPASEAVLAAWTDPGRSPTWHSRQRVDMTYRMPVLARALYRLEAEARDRK